MFAVRFAMITCACFAAVGADAEALRLQQDGVERIIWVDDGRADKTMQAPLVLAIHGYHHPEAAAARYETPADLAWPDLAALTAQHGFVTLYPGSYRGQWALFDGLSNTETPDGAFVDDEAFLLGLVDRFVANGIADPDRIYITGISDGAIMTYRMICLPETPFAAAAPLIGTAFADHLDDCTPKTPPALMHVHGTDDAVLPYDGWLFASGREVSVPEVMDHWRTLHGCTSQEGQMLENLDPDDGSRVGEMTWTNCTRDGTVRRYKVIGGGHDVPDIDAAPREDGRLINRDLDTLPVMWAFFQANPRAN